MLNIICSLLTFGVMIILINVSLIHSSRDTVLENIFQHLDYNKLGLEYLIVDVFTKSWQNGKCIVIINDDLYNDVVQSRFFKLFGITLSYFLIKVKDSDDLLAPSETIQQILVQARTESCQMYIILIANGIQSSRLLQFGDRYRVLDTRAKFVLLYDPRLFYNKLHYIWKRIINVVFIREYYSRNQGKLSNPWFELSTVPFPSTIKGVFISKPLDIWKDSKFRKGAQLFESKSNNLKNNTLKVITFEHIPSTLKVFSSPYDTSNLLPIDNQFFTGIEIEILHTLARVMNFSATLYETQNTKTVIRESNTTASQYPGLFWEMFTSKADIALGGLHYMLYNLEIMDLSVPYNTECLTFLTPESLTDISWKTLIRPFRPLMWLVTILVLIGSIFVFYFLAKFHRSYSWEGSQSKNGLYIFETLDNGILYTYGMMMLVSLPKLPERWSLRVLTGWFWLYSILLVVAYRASMTAILANPATRITIDTIEALLDSKLHCGGPEIDLNFFQHSRDDSLMEIASFYQPINDTDEAVLKVISGKFAYYESVHFLQTAITNSESAKDSNVSSENATNAVKNSDEYYKTEHSLHIMKNCIINMPISFGLQKNSPIKAKVDKTIRTIIEAGLVNKWLKDIMQSVLKRSFKQQGSMKALMDLKKFYGGLVVLGIGYALGFLVLFGEIMHFNFRVKKHPDFNKYLSNVVKAKQ